MLKNILRWSTNDRFAYILHISCCPVLIFFAYRSSGIIICFTGKWFTTWGEAFVLRVGYIYLDNKLACGRDISGKQSEMLFVQGRG